VDWTFIVAGILPAAITAIVAIYGATKLGVGPIVKQADEQTDRLIERLQQRVRDLEEENARLRAENQNLEVRVARLEGQLLDFFISQRIDNDD
jgi:cell division protein FtsB